MRKLALVFLLAGTAIAAPAAAATFTVSINPPVGTPGCPGDPNASGSSPVSRSSACSPVGGASLLDARAAADFGHVGARAAAAHNGGFIGIQAGSSYADTVTFTSTDPNATSVSVAANLAFSGAMNGTEFGFASVSLFYFLYTQGFFFNADNNAGVTRNQFDLAEGTVSSTLNSALLRSATMVVPLGQPISMQMSIGTSAGVLGDGTGFVQSATSHFSNSFEVPFGMDAFVLPDGVTANSGTWLVNNRRVDPTAVPEPAAWATMILGFGAVGALMRRRRPQTRSGAYA